MVQNSLLPLQNVPQVSAVAGTVVQKKHWISHLVVLPQPSAFFVPGLQYYLGVMSYLLDFLPTQDFNTPWSGGSHTEHTWWCIWWRQHESVFQITGNNNNAWPWKIGFQDWRKLGNMEELIHISQDCIPAYHKTWLNWTHFQNTTGYKDIVISSLPSGTWVEQVLQHR